MLTKGISSSLISSSFTGFTGDGSLLEGDRLGDFSNTGDFIGEGDFVGEGDFIGEDGSVFTFTFSASSLFLSLCFSEEELCFELLPSLCL